MKLLIFLLTVSFLNCNNQSKQNQKSFSGLLDVPGSIFQYKGEGQGIPCVVFTGSENLGHKMYTDELRENLNMIHADPGKIKIEELDRITIEAIVDDIENLRVWLKIDKIAVLGHSMFGTLPLEYALKYPDHIYYSISSGALPFVNDKAFKAQREYWQNEASEERKKILQENNAKLKAQDLNNMPASERFIKGYIANIPYRFYDLHYDMSKFWEDEKINMDFVNHFWGVLMKNYDNTKNFKNISTPILVITGKYDFGAPYYLWNEYETIIPDMKIVVFQNAGHNPMLESPEEFDKVIIDWINSKKK